MKETSEAFLTQARSLLQSDYLPKIERCLEALNDEEVWWRANPESNSIGNLVLHLAGNARQWIISGIGGADDARERQKEFDAVAGYPRKELLSVLRATLDEVDRVLAGIEPESLLDRYEIQGGNVSGLEAIFHVVEHFSMHTGQIILLTKLLTKSDLRFYNFSSGAPIQTLSKNPGLNPD